KSNIRYSISMLCVRYPFNKKNLKKNECILDIETTGLDAKRDKLVVLGLIYFDNKKNIFYIDQYFSNNDKEEIKLLKIYKEKIKNRRLITYNGEIFDLPFLNIRLIENKLDSVFPENRDLFKIIKSKRKLIEFESMKLINIEKIVGIERNDPSRYKVISKLSDKDENRNNPWPILIHNKNDLIATEAISNIEEIINDKLSFAIKNYKIYLENAYIDKDIANLEFRSNKKLENSLFQGENYSFSIKDKFIKLKIMVLYGKLSKNSSGFVSVNNFNLENKGLYKINKNLIAIMEDGIYSCENILNIMKFLIEKNLDL
ncbi:MAG: ribonuclease H-like domain-containing protein, partial [Anaerococcus vaginalis]|nr:ribonuclease H-like domain-containing protein [Anaerococcus vaginalis]